MEVDPKIIEHRPWGKYEVLYDGDDCKVKRITVNSGGALSLQYHKQREELWKIISGVGTVTVGDETYNVSPGDIITINKLQRHRIRNFRNTPVVFIEIQTGEYFGEDDIVRIKDKYGRV